MLATMYMPFSDIDLLVSLLLIGQFRTQNLVLAIFRTLELRIDVLELLLHFYLVSLQDTHFVLLFDQQRRLAATLVTNVLKVD